MLAGDEMQVLDGAALTIEKGCILHIGEVLPESQVVDMSGMLLCPMFIDAHIHLGDTGAKDLATGLPLEQAVNPPHGLKHRFLDSLDDEIYIEMMRHGLKEMLANGVIACADFREQGMKGVAALQQAAAGLPARAVILGRMAESENPVQVEAECHELLSTADGIGVRDISSYDVTLLSRLRAEYPQKIFAAHSSEDARAEEHSIRQTGRGQTSRNLDWNPDMLVHLVHTPPQELERVAQLGVWAISCPRCNGILGDGLVNLAQWKRAGVSFALGTDNVMFNSIDMLREMDYASRTTRGLTRDAGAIDALSILKAATIEGARALKLARELGSLSQGKEASFVVFDLNKPNMKYSHDVINALVHRTSTADINAIYIRGRRLEQWL